MTHIIGFFHEKTKMSMSPDWLAVVRKVYKLQVVILSIYGIMDITIIEVLNQLCAG